MTCYIFPGQGSQKVGMGETIFNKYPEYISKANTILGYDCKSLCLEDKQNQLALTQFTQPALYIVECLTYLDQKTTPKYLAGHSLGEYSALFAANVFNFETGLKLVKKRGELMSQATEGGMAAIIGLSSDAIRNLLQKHNFNNIQIANLNEPNQTVISGNKQQINTAKETFESEGAKRYIPLPVSGAFHSTYMEPAKHTFEAYLDTFTFNPPEIPVISNVTAKPYQSNEIKTLLSKQIVSSVRWVESIEYLINQGETEFVEIGPGKVLTGLVAKIKRCLNTQKTITI